MSKHYLTVIGAGKYDECSYAVLNDKTIEKSYRTKYVQSAVLDFFCEDFNEGDRITVFLTRKAREHFEEFCGDIKKVISDRNIMINDVDILEGFSPEDQWKNFNIIYDQIDRDEEVTVDITHGFRTIPMQLFIVLDYAKKLKNISVNGVYYGVYEQPFGIKDGEYVPNDILNEKYLLKTEKRRAYSSDIAVYYPIVDYRSYLMISELSNAAYSFAETGDAVMLGRIASQSKGKRFKDKNFSEKAKKEFTDLGGISDDLRCITESIKCLRGNSLPDSVRCSENGSGEKVKIYPEGEKSIYHALKKYQLDMSKTALEPGDESEAKAIRNIIDYMKEVIEKHFGDVIESGDETAEANIKTGMCVIEWCIRYGLVQAGYTALEETFITWLRTLVTDEMISSVTGDPDMSEREKRSFAGRLATEKAEVSDSTQSGSSICVKLLSEKYPECDIKGIMQLLDKIKQARNDINHFGFSTDQRKTGDLKRDLKKYYGFFEKYKKSFS